ncbi:MlaE family ABC transporter permease, partial [Thermodesulfobacteriota bacterium]
MRWLISAIEEVGQTVSLLGQSAVWLFKRPFRLSEIVRQVEFVGVQSFLLVSLAGLFTGMVLGLQSHNVMNRYGAESLIGAAISVSLSRELGPVLTALIVIGRAGSAITAELGSMRNTDQIDALRSMAVEPVQYLIVPRILASTIALPMLTAFFVFAGTLGAYIVVTTQVGLVYERIYGRFGHRIQT